MRNGVTVDDLIELEKRQKVRNGGHRSGEAVGTGDTSVVAGGTIVAVVVASSFLQAAQDSSEALSVHRYNRYNRYNRYDRSNRYDRYVMLCAGGAAQLGGALGALAQEDLQVHRADGDQVVPRE